MDDFFVKTFSEQLKLTCHSPFSPFQLIPQISSLSWFTTIVPLALVLSITAVKDATDDYVSIFPLTACLQSRLWQDNVTLQEYERSWLTALNVTCEQEVSNTCWARFPKRWLETLSPAVSSQKRQPSQQPSISGPHPRLVSLINHWRLNSNYFNLISHLLMFFSPLFHFLRLQNEKWMNVRVGDIIKLENNQFVAVRHSLMLWYTSLHMHRNTHDEKVFRHHWLTKILLIVPAASVQHQCMLTSAPGSVFRLTCSSCPPVNPTVSVTSRQPSWTGQTTQHALSQTRSTLQYTEAVEHNHWKAVCLFYPAERPIWRCASPSLWHLTLETRTTWLHSMVRSQSNLLLFSGFGASYFMTI